MNLSPISPLPRHLKWTEWLSLLAVQFQMKDPWGVSGWARLGRTGIILACYLVSQGSNADRAIKEVRDKRPGSIEKEEQEKAIGAYASHMGKRLIKQTKSIL